MWGGEGNGDEGFLLGLDGFFDGYGGIWGFVKLRCMRRLMYELCI